MGTSLKRAAEGLYGSSIKVGEQLDENEKRFLKDKPHGLKLKEPKRE